QHHELQEHHATTSLFLESLFRRDHFVQGHLVLRPRYCRVEDEIIGPQLEHFAGRFKVRGITVEAPTDMIGEEVLLVVDVGLLSQVYANFFSNALKYVEEIIDHRNKARKAVAYGREIIRDCFGPGRHGIKFNVFTTGRHLSDEEAAAVFNEGFRSVKYRNLPGTGHGLAFVKQVIEIHGGVVGYERTPEGNNFFFVLPLPEADSPLSEILARSSGP
ncbi:MAG: ATP-binding protein, partial [Desulfobulbaceae bacterium]|nr:ATP-binding protein [Desulfobulbaceae bacterium]